MSPWSSEVISETKHFPSDTAEKEILYQYHCLWVPLHGFPGFLGVVLQEGREGVKWKVGFALFRRWEMGFCALGLGFMKQKQ